MAESVPRKLIVAALVFDADERILLTQRTAEQAHPLEWEFPGGKIEPGEAPEDALRRELREELDIDVDVGRVWEVLHHRYPRFEILMLVYPARLAAGSVVRPVEVAAFKWLTPSELDAHSILDADKGLVARLVKEGFPLN